MRKILLKNFRLGSCCIFYYLFIWKNHPFQKVCLFNDFLACSDRYVYNIDLIKNKYNICIFIFILIFQYFSEFLNIRPRIITFSKTTFFVNVKYDNTSWWNFLYKKIDYLFMGEYNRISLNLNWNKK